VGTTVPEATEFNVGSIDTFEIINKQEIENQLIAYNEGFGGELGGDENGDGNIIDFVPDFFVTVQFEIAYERVAFTGSKTGCVSNPTNDTQTCFFSTQAWWPQNTPADMNVTSVVSTIPPLIPFWECYGACWRASSGEAWSCGGVLAIPNYATAPGLGFCTKNP
jgi:hypothetical protein